MMKKIAFIAMALALAGCEKSLEDQQASVEKFFHKNKIGSGTDYFLVKNSFAGPQKIGVIYGFPDDFSFCMDLARMHMEKYPLDSYSCEAANF